MVEGVFALGKPHRHAIALLFIERKRALNQPVVQYFRQIEHFVVSIGLFFAGKRHFFLTFTNHYIFNFNRHDAASQYCVFIQYIKFLPRTQMMHIKTCANVFVYNAAHVFLLRKRVMTVLGTAHAGRAPLTRH